MLERASLPRWASPNVPLLLAVLLPLLLPACRAAQPTTLVELRGDTSAGNRVVLFTSRERVQHHDRDVAALERLESEIGGDFYSFVYVDCGDQTNEADCELHGFIEIVTSNDAWGVPVSSMPRAQWFVHTREGGVEKVEEKKGRDVIDAVREHAVFRSAPVEGKTIVPFSSRQALNEHLESGEDVVAIFCRSWAGTCKQAGPHFEYLSADPELNRHFRFVTVDCDVHEPECQNVEWVPSVHVLTRSDVNPGSSTVTFMAEPNFHLLRPFLRSWLTKNRGVADIWGAEGPSSSLGSEAEATAQSPQGSATTAPARAADPPANSVADLVKFLQQSEQRIIGYIDQKVGDLDRKIQDLQQEGGAAPGGREL